MKDGLSHFCWSTSVKSKSVEPLEGESGEVLSLGLRQRGVFQPDLWTLSTAAAALQLSLSSPCLCINPAPLMSSLFLTSCSLLTLAWRRSTETTALDNTSPTEKTKTWPAQRATPPSTHIWASNRGVYAFPIRHWQWNHVAFMSLVDWIMVY